MRCNTLRGEVLISDDLDIAPVGRSAALRRPAPQLQVPLVARPRNQNASKGLQKIWRPFFVRAIQGLVDADSASTRSRWSRASS